MADPSQMTDAELFAIAGEQPQPRPQQDRGTRNRNPGNLKASSWSQRQPGYVGQDRDGFAMFDTPESGEAAQVNLLRSNYSGRSPSQIINRYAPVGPENSQESVNNYINYASRRVGIDPSQPVPDELMGDFARAMREFETGQTVPLTDAGDAGVEGMSDEELMALAGETLPDEAPDPGPATPGSSRENLIDLAADRLYQDEVDALKKGAWVRDREGNVFQLPGDAFTANARSTDEAQGGNVLLRRPNLEDKIGAFASAASEQIPFLDESVAFTSGLATGEGYQAMRDAQARNIELLNQTDRGARIAGGVAGFGTSFLAPGAAFIGRGTNLASRSARAAGVGGGIGALYGAGAADEGGLGNRAMGAAAGGTIGAFTGGAAPGAGQVASSVSNFFTRPLGRAANYLTGGNVAALRRFSPEAQAQTRISEALRNDNVSRQSLVDAMQGFTDSGVRPSLIDIIQRAAPGGEAARLIRGSAMQQGPASVAAERYLERIGGNIQDNAIDLTRRLTPDTRTAEELTEALTRQRANAAATDYAGPYAERLTPTPEALRALEGDPGLAAMRRARTAAVARQDEGQIGDIDSLMATVRAVGANPGLSGRIPAPEVSGATLDRIQRAMGGRARAMEMSPDTRDIASGLYGRQGALNDFLDSVPGLAQARGNYRDVTRQIDAVEDGGTGLNAAPDSFSFDDLTRPSAAVGYRSALERALGAGAETSTGTMNRVATSANQTRNLREVFGEGAEQYQAGLGNLLDQLRNARFLASSSGSQTAPRLADQALAGIAALPATAKAGLIGLLEKAGRGATLTRAERQAIVELGVSEAELRDIATTPFISQYLVAPVSAGAGQLPARATW